MKLGNLLRKNNSPEVTNEVTSPVITPRPRDIWAEKDEPSLVLLVPDAAGRASYHLNTFQSTAAAVSFFKFWTLDSGNANCIAFWALLYPPVKSEDAEAIVLIREPGSTTRIYPFSFTSMDDAMDFVRRETENGLQLSDAIVYWAARVEVRQTAFDVQMSPAYPPEVRVAGPRGLVFEMPTVFVQKPDSEDPKPERNGHVTIADEATSTVDDTVSQPPRATPAVEAELPAAKAPRAKKPEASQASDRRKAPRKTEDSQDRRKATRKARKVEVAPEVIEAAIKTLTDKARKTNGHHAPTEPLVIEVTADRQAEVESRSEEASPAASAEAPSPAAQTPDDQETGWMVTEMERFQARRRWDAPEGPFQGFDSPQGRF